MLTRIGGIGLLVGLALVGQGCASVAPPTGINYTLDGIAFRTFSTPVDQMRRATLTTFKRMEMDVKSDDSNEEGGRELVALAGDRTIHVELEKLTARTTRMRITAKNGWLWRDRSTAGEIIVQTERALEEMPAVTRAK